MGTDCLSGLSPGYRRGNNPMSPSPFKRSLSSPDISWRSLAHRHKFLLYMLGLLTLLCTIYLYFAITLGANNSCSGLGGPQRALCQLRVNRLKSDALKAHHRRLLHVEESDSTEKPHVHIPFIKGDVKEFLAYMSNLPAGKDLERLRGTRVPLGHNGEVWQGDFETLKAMFKDIPVRRAGGSVKELIALLDPHFDYEGWKKSSRIETSLNVNAQSRNDDIAAFEGGFDSELKKDNFKVAKDSNKPPKVTRLRDVLPRNLHLEGLT